MRDTSLDLLLDMVRIPSLCGEEDALATMLLDYLKGAGFDAHRDAVGNVHGTIGDRDADRSVIILGHLDTAPGCIRVRIEDGKLYGRGAVDAKGPLAAAILAAEAAGPRARARITVIGAVQEEGPSLGARHLMQFPAPDFLIIAEPGGWDAVVLGYKGSQRFTVTLEQPAQHTAVPRPTAPERLVCFWNDLAAWCAHHGGTRSGERTFDALVPALLSMSSDNDGLNDRAALHIGLRLPPNLSLEEVPASVPQLLPDAQFEFAPGEEAVQGSKSTPLVASFLRAVRAQEGKPRFKLKTGTSDMNIVGPAWNCPMLAYGPGDSRLDHTATEHIDVDEFRRGVRVLTTALESL